MQKNNNLGKGIKTKELLFFFICIAPVLILLYYLIVFSIDAPTQHDWGFFSRISDGNFGRTIINFWIPTNGHRVPFIFLIYYFDFIAFGFNSILIVYLNFTIYVINLLLLFKIFTKCIPDKKYFFLIVPWILLNLIQSNNLLIQWQLTINAGISGALFSLYFLHKGTMRSTVAAVILFVISSCSFLSGLVVYPLGIVLIYFKQFDKRIKLLWILAGVLFFVFYFYNYNISSGQSLHSLNIKSIENIILFIPVIISLPFTLPIGKIGDGLVYAGVISGIIIWLIIIGLTVLKIRKEKNIFNHRNSLVFICLIYFLIVFIEISFGRSSEGVAESYSSQYVTFGIYGLIFLYIFIVSLSKEKVSGNYEKYLIKISRFLIIIFIAASLLIGNIFGIYMGHVLKGEKIKTQFVVNNVHTLPASALESVCGDTVLLIDVVDNFNKISSFNIGHYKKEILNPYPAGKFSDTQKIIIPSDSLIIYFTCPFSLLNSINIIANSFDNPMNIISIKLLEGSNLIFSKEINQEEITENGLIKLKFNPAISNSLNKSYKIVITGLSNQLSFPLYDKYYNGETFIDGQSLTNLTAGLEINSGALLYDYYKSEAQRNNLKYLFKN